MKKKGRWRKEENESEWERNEGPVSRERKRMKGDKLC